MPGNRRFSLKFLMAFVAAICIGVYAYTNRINIANALIYRNVCVARTTTYHRNSDVIDIRINNDSNIQHTLIYRDSISQIMEFTIFPKQDAQLKCQTDSDGNFQVFWNGKLQLEKKLPQGSGIGVVYYQAEPVIIGPINSNPYSYGRISKNAIVLYEFDVDLK